MSELTFAMFEDVQNMNTTNMIDLPKLSDSTDAKKAQENYNKALVGFYKALPTDKDGKPGEYQVIVMDLATKLADAWTAYSEAIGEKKVKDVAYMDP